MVQTIRDLKELGPALGVDTKKAKPPYWNSKALPIRMDRVLAFIVHYQSRHSGQTPSKHLISEEMQEPEQAVQYWLNQLENAGLIGVIGRNPLRVMVKTTTKDLEGARRLDDALKGARFGWETDTPHERYDAAEAQRMRLGRFIGAYRQQHKHGPSLTEMAAELGMSGPGYVVGALHILAKRGLLTYQIDTPRSAKLTEEGNMVFGVHTSAPTKAELAAASPTPIARTAPRSAFPKLTPRKAHQKKLEQIYRYMAAHAREHGRGPTRADLMQQFGYHQGPNVSSALVPLVNAGLVKGGSRSGYKVFDLNGSEIGGGMAGKAKAPKREAGSRNPHHMDALALAREASRQKWEAKLERAKQFIYDTVAVKGRGPSKSELAEHMGRKRDNLQSLIDALRGRGIIGDRGVGGRARSYPVLVDGKVIAEAQVVEQKATGRHASPLSPPSQPKENNRVTTQTLPQRALALASFVYDYVNQWGDAPEYSQMAAAAGYIKSSSVAPVLEYLEAHGWITREKYRHRSVRLTEVGEKRVLAARGVQPEAVAEKVERVLDTPDSAPPPNVSWPMPMRVLDWREQLDKPLVTDDRAARLEALTSEPAPPPAPALTPKDFDTLDLVEELLERGYVIRKAVS